MKSDVDFHRLQVVFGSSAVHVNAPLPRGVTEEFFVSMRVTAAHCQLPVIVISHIPNCSLISANPRATASRCRK